MTKLFKFYKTLNSNVKMIVKSTLLLYIFLVLAAIFPHLPFETAVGDALADVSDDFLIAARSVLFIGFPGAILFNYLEKDR